ncbi:hypothetical protein Mal64_02620 [Pseudobythopirellula maris]|uniref:Uncharacterized protein n=1 Tax=Pseudobythopirellula maris TaxID=2527991 RepID=A0A5C5ZRF8_9BACT|nr:HlyD family efflux transporter periplasmic adaptor subunit [Pseudobythopirellula maris]TWT89880.1 hypothetical protein Mal64_02620 [Pseudobythopirellula maris]
MAPTSSNADTAASEQSDRPCDRDGEAVWSVLGETLEELALLAAGAGGAEAFYEQLLRASSDRLAAAGGAVWLVEEPGRLRPLLALGVGAEDEQRELREADLSRAVVHREATYVGSSCVIARVPSGGGSAAGGTAALIELLFAPDTPAERLDCAAEFLAEAAAIAAARHKATGVGSSQHDLAALLRFASDTGRDTRLTPTAMRIVEGSRRLGHCDRVSLVRTAGAGRLTRCELLAVSGASRVERRGQAARRLERLARLCRHDGEPLWLDQDHTERGGAEAEIATDLLHEHADGSHARQVLAVPIRLAPEPGEELAPVLGVLIGERFDGEPLDKPMLLESAAVCAPALSAAIEYDSLPLLGFSKALRALKRPGGWLRVLLAAVVTAALAAALLLIQADDVVVARGELRPAVRSDLFAPASGLVDRVQVAHGDRVAEGQPLVVLRDPQNDLQLSRLTGELLTAERQLDAIAAARASLDSRRGEPTDSLRLSAEARELGQRLESLREELALYERDRQALTVRSPIAGRVISWRIEQKIDARPVERGQLLVSVVADDAPWRLELAAPDDRIGRLLAAERESAEPLAVEFRLSTLGDKELTGRVVEIAASATAPVGDGARPSVLVTVEPDSPLLSEAEGRRTLRPGETVLARVHCGQKPLGRVWLGDLVDALVTWWRF